MTREQAAAAVGISRKLAAFHLDRLVTAGLLDVTYARPASDTTKRGRAPKRYQLSDMEVEVSIPARHYDFVGEILVDAVARAISGADPADAVSKTSWQRGKQVGASARQERRLGRLGPERGLAILTELLHEQGFDPADTGDSLVQRNCPFHRLAQRHPELVCGINRDYVGGVLAGLEAQRLDATLDPAPDRCCVVVRTTAE